MSATPEMPASWSEVKQTFPTWADLKRRVPDLAALKRPTANRED